MSEQELKPRHRAGLVVIALLLGAPSLMLWMGRFRLAVVYAVMGLLIVILTLVSVASGGLTLDLGRIIDPSITVMGIGWLPVAVAFFHALSLNKQSPIRPWYSRWYVALSFPIVASLALALVVRTFFYQPFNVPSLSNVPNLMLGDYFFVSKQAYKSRDPERGEIAVFKLPSDPGIDYVKRVIGLPGDRIQMKQGRLYLNGQMVPRQPFAYRLPLDQEGFRPVQFYRETLPNGRSYIIAEAGDDLDADNTDEYVVPEGHYFALGDSRDNSQDSRFLAQVGYIPRANFVGPFVVRFWNSHGVPLNGRPEETPAQ